MKFFRALLGRDRDRQPVVPKADASAKGDTAPKRSKARDGMYLFLVSADEQPSAHLLNRALQHYQKTYGGNVFMLAGLQIAPPLPQQFDHTLASMCAGITFAAGIEVSSPSLDIRYSVDNNGSRKIGTVKVIVGPQLSRFSTKQGPFCRTCSSELAVLSDELAQASPGLLLYSGTICRECVQILCDTCHAPSKPNVCSCGGELLPCYAKEY
jgi:hypothetical protein